MSYPVDVDYAYDRLPPDLFTATAPGGSGPGVPWRGSGLDRWAPLLPPLLSPGLGEGATPLVELESGVFIKDESRNPTWSHKDRLNRCAVSAAAGVRSNGTPSSGPVVCIVTSSGFKDAATCRASVTSTTPEWSSVAPRLRAAGLLP